MECLAGTGQRVTTPSLHELAYLLVIPTFQTFVCLGFLRAHITYTAKDKPSHLLGPQMEETTDSYSSSS